MPYQPYYPGGWQPGPGGQTPISADALNHMEGQYDAVKEELQKTDGTSDMPITTPGGTEATRLAVTDSNGRVGDSIRIGGMRIITGRQTATGTNGEGRISFGFTFSSSPVIVATIERTSGTGNLPRIIEINSRSTTGFSWTVRNPDSTSGSGTGAGWTAFYWIAIGPG